MTISQHDWYERLRFTVDEVVTRFRQHASNAPSVKHRFTSRHGRSRSRLGVLEPRLLFSATPIDPAMIGDDGQGSETVLVVDAEESQASESSSVASSVQHASGELIVIDGNVPELQSLLDDLSESRPDAEVFVLDPTRDGVQQITQLLDSQSNLSSLHIVSHGQDSAIRLGNVWLGNDNLSGYAGEIADWQSALSSDADILFYGCDLAADVEGRDFLESMQALTNADIAASDDITGHENRGGDWDLEYVSGTIETDIAFSIQLQGNWEHTLPGVVIDVTILDDVVDAADGETSLREAVAQAVAGDTIQLGAGVHLVNDSIDLSQGFAIVGLDARSTIIDASQGTGDRVFNIDSDSVVDISKLTIQGGNQNNGGAIFVEDGTLNLTDAILRDNSSNNGGAIHVHGTAHLNRVLLTGNTASDEGGAIHFHSDGVGSLTNVTISDNTATSGGGGVFVDSSGTVTITNSTIVRNDGFSGGGIVNGGGTVVLKNTIVAENTASNAHKDVSGVFSSDGSNLLGDNTGSFGLSSDTVSSNIGLANLSNNGGQTDTHALQGGSIAIDAGVLAGAPTIDGRGIARYASVDIGAYEFVPLTAADEFRVNTTTVNQQATSAEDRGSQHAIAMAGDGSYVVVWSSENQNGTGFGIYARRFDATGTALTGEITVADTANKVERWARVASAGDGSFVVTWTDQPGSSDRVVLRRFDANGVALTDIEGVNSTFPGDQKNSVIAMNAATGEFVIAWQGNGNRSGQVDSAGIFAQRYDANGEAVGGEFRVNSETSGTQFDTSIAMNDSGEFIIVWDDGDGVHSQRFNASGNPQGGQVTVDGSSSAGNADVAIHSDGSYVVTWREGGNNNRGVLLRRYDSSGDSLTEAVRVNTFTTDNQTNPSIAMDNAGRFTIVWEGRGTDDTEGVFAQKYDAAGNTVGGNFLVNQTTNGSQTNASLVMRDSDNFVVVWSGNGEQSGNIDSDGVFARQFGTFDSNDAPTFTATADNPTFTENDSSPVSLFSDSNASTIESGQAFKELVLTVSNVRNGASEIIQVDGSDLTLTNGNTGTTASLSLNYSISVSGTVATVTLNGAVIDASQLNSLVNTLSYQNTSENPDTANRIVTITRLRDSGGTDSGGNDTSTPNIASTVTVNALNDAPTLSGGPTTLNGTNDNAVSLGTRISALLDTLTTNDAEDNTLGIAVNSASGIGTWQFSTNSSDGANGDWSSFATVSNTNAMLLLSSSWIRYQPVANTGETATIGFAAWDGTTGAASTNGTPSTVDRGDGGGTSAFSSSVASASLTVTNLNPNAPVIDANQVALVLETASNNAVVMTASATDEDAGSTLGDWTIVSGNTNDVFQINASTGVIRVNNASELDYESTQSYTLVLTVGDGANTSEQENVTIQVTDANDNAPVISEGLSGIVPEDAADQTTILTATANDDDAGTTFSSWAIVSGNTGNVFQIDANTGTIRVNDTSELDFESIQNYTLGITVSDGVNSSASRDVVINVTDANDPSTGQPVIQGTPMVGSILEVDLSGITDEDGIGDPVYQWYRDGVAVASATTDKYLLTNADKGFEIGVTISFVDESGNSEGPLSSNPTSAVIADPNALPTFIPPPPPQAASLPPPSSSIESGGDDSGASETKDSESKSDSDTNRDSETNKIDKAVAVQTAGKTGQGTEQSGTDAGTLPVAVAGNSNAGSNDSDGSPQADTTFENTTDASRSAAPSRTLRSSNTSQSEIDFDATRINNEASGLLWEDLVVLTRPGAMWDELDQRQQGVETLIQGDLIVMGSAGAAASSFTVGAIAWAMRSGFLVSGLIAHMPAWSGVDPLMVMQGIGNGGEGSTETLEELMDRQSKAMESEDGSQGEQQ